MAAIHLRLQFKLCPASPLTQEPPLTIARVALYARVSTLNGQDPEMQGAIGRGTSNLLS